MVLESTVWWESKTWSDIIHILYYTYWQGHEGSKLKITGTNLFWHGIVVAYLVSLTLSFTGLANAVFCYKLNTAQHPTAQCSTVLFNSSNPTINITLYLPNPHSFFNICWSYLIPKVHYKLCKLFDIDDILRVLWICIDDLCTPGYL